ncbi:MAG TPA: helix-turn-helix transcriptional regulator [Chloroflexota bacterium]|nr:helix-turn-helix transcriptional regulator [Chloroflexota bacterium]
MASLRQARVDRLLTIRELAHQAGVSPSTVYLVEAGRTRPSFRVIRLLAQALAVEPQSVDEFANVMGSLATPRPGESLAAPGPRGR